VAAARRVSGLFTALVVDADVEAPVPWLATAYVNGPSLAETIDNHGPLSPRSAVALAAGLAEGLNAIHVAGVVHGDLKPSNVLLAEDGPRVIDFGISRAAGAAPLTHPGLVMGSPGFMSPEQAMGRETGPRSDVFSLGAVLAYASTGERPFGQGSAAVRLDRVINAEPDLSKVPDELRAVVQLCLEKDLAKRPTAADVLTDVGNMQSGTDWLPESIMRMFPKDIPFSDSGPPSQSTITGFSSAYPGAVSSPEIDEWPRHGGDRSQPAEAPYQGEQEYADSGDRRSPERPQPADALLGGGQGSSAAAPHAGEQRAAGMLTAEPGRPGDEREDAWGARGATKTRPRTEQTPTGGTPPDDQVTQGSDAGAQVPLWRLTAAALLVLVLLVASGAAGYFLIGAVRHPAASSPQPTVSPTLASSSVPPTSPAKPTTSAGGSSGVPQITRTSTYTYDSDVYFEVTYTGRNASGFGFAGADGSSLAEQNHSFAEPGAGLVTGNTVRYPIDEQCGTTGHSTSWVKVWITYGAQARSNQVTLHLVCSG
jgi:hypothetical protein